MVGYGADPQAVVDTVREYQSRGALVIKGNHDEAIEKHPRYMNDAAKDSIDWTRKSLSAECRLFLSSLPLVEHEGGVCFVHASADAPARWDYVDSPRAAQRSAEAAGVNYTFSGHVHDQALYFEGARRKWAAFQPKPGSAVPAGKHRIWLALVGSVGQPRDGRTAAAYALFDTQREQITFHRVAYDHLTAARKIRQAGLPELHAYRVEKGV
jgi:diadenosine tetraphosphatase ApaH/serine/threonine PP2A family protein phosphatase